MQYASKYKNHKVAIEVILLHIIKIHREPTLQDLTRRLFDLEKKLQRDLPFTKQSEQPVAPTIKTLLTKDYDTLLQFAAVELNGIIKK